MPRPLHSLTSAEVSAICADHFGLDVVPGEFLAGEIAVNIAVEPGLVLKAEYPSTNMTPEHTDWICTVQELARDAAAPVAAQAQALRPFASTQGQSSGKLALGDVDGDLVMFRLQDFLPGDIAAGHDAYPAYPRQVGALTAQIVDALAAAPREPAPVLHPWSFETSGANVAFACDRIRSLEASGRVPAEFSTLSADVALARRVAQAFDALVRPVLPELPHQVVHQDINDFNILVEAQQIAGLIDFGDCRTAPRMAEAAVAGSYTMLGRDDPRAVLGEFVDAYQQAALAPLTPQEVALVELGALTRLCLNACTWTSRTLTGAPSDPGFEYGRSRMERTWPVIRTIAHEVLAS